MGSSHEPLMLCTAALLLLFATVPAQDTTAIPGVSGDVLGSASNATSNITSVEQPLPPFTAIRSCLPYNILVAAPNTSDSSTASTNGRIIIQADFDVLNATVAAVEDGVLTLSLSGGFESHQPINFTVVVPGGATKLRAVSNYGSGLVVLGPGHKVTSLRLATPTVGQIVAVNVTADAVTLQSSGVLSSYISGSLQRVEISSTGTGSIAVVSTVPTNMAVKLSGITTVLADLPAGSAIKGRAEGLSKVQYTDGRCVLTSNVPRLFAAPSFFGGGIFGSSGSPFGQSCQQVPAAQLQPAVAAGGNPQWTCGIIVDGRQSCQGGNGTVIPWNISGAGTAAAAAADSTAAAAAPATADTTGGAGRKLLQVDPTTTTTPTGEITTGAQTSGQGSFASGTGSVSGPAGTTTQQTTSAGGSQPQTTTTGGVGSNIFNPVYVPATPADVFTAEANNTGNATEATANVNTAGGTSAAGAGGSGQSQASASSSGPGTSTGIAVASTTCQSRAQSLSMLVQPLQGETVGSGTTGGQTQTINAGGGTFASATGDQTSVNAVNNGNTASSSSFSSSGLSPSPTP